MRKTKKYVSVIAYIVFGLWTVFTVFPIIWVMYSSLKTNPEILANAVALPRFDSLQFSNYLEAWTLGRLGSLFINSFIYTFSSTALILLFAMMISYALVKMPQFSHISKVLYGVIALGFLVTVQALLIPLVLLFKQIGLTDTRISIIITYTALGLPMAVYLSADYMRSIPDTLIESAFLDGAGHSYLFIKIIMPLCRPILTTVAILSILGAWNEFLLVFVLTSSDTTRSLPVGLLSFSSTTSTEYGLQFAALVIGFLPILIFYGIANKYITQGVIAGAIKE